MNNKGFKSFLSVILSLSLVISTFCIDVYATEINENVNTVFLQRDNEIEAIDLPSNLSPTETSKLKQNILLHGNTYLSEQQIEKIKKEALLRGGLNYGSWFGGYTEYYSMSFDESVVFLSALTAFVLPFLNSAGVIAVSANKVANGLMITIGLNYSLPGTVKEGEWIKADLAKKYREVKYSDGTFAYFETGFFASNLNVANKRYGSPVTIFSGGMY